jgi:hypothetical protein
VPSCVPVATCYDSARDPNDARLAQMASEPIEWRRDVEKRDPVFERSAVECDVGSEGRGQLLFMEDGLPGALWNASAAADAEFRIDEELVR